MDIWGKETGLINTFGNLLVWFDITVSPTSVKWIRWDRSVDYFVTCLPGNGNILA